MTELSDYKRIVEGPRIAALETKIRRLNALLEQRTEALREIVKPLGNPPDTMGGDKAASVIRFWRGVAVRCREIARASLNDKEGGNDR